MNTDTSFHDLKKELEQSGYTTPLGIESAPLVKQLFHDIKKFRSDCDRSQKHIDEANKKISHLSDTVNSLKRENSTLIEAKNALHGDICRNSELMDEVERKAREAVSAAQASANNYRFQLNTAMYQVKAQETDINRLKQKIVSLLEKSQYFVQADSVNSRSKQILEINCERFEKIVPRAAPPSSPNYAALLEIAESKIDALQDQVAHVNGVCDQLKQQKIALEKAISIRDNEIRQKEANSSTRSSDDRKSRQLSDQVDFLTKEMIRQESDLKHYRAMEPLVERLQAQRDELQESLNRSQEELARLQDDLAQQKKAVVDLTEEKERDLNLSKTRIPRAVKELEAAQVTIRRLQSRIQEVEHDKKQIEQEYDEIKKIFQSYTSDKSLLSSLLEEAEIRAAETQRQLNELNEECSSLREQNSKLRTQLQAMRQSTETFQKDIELHQQTVSQQQADLSKERNKNRVLLEKISSLEQTIETLSHDGEVLAQKLERVNAENKMLKESIQDHVATATSDARKEASEKSLAQRQTSIIRDLQAERDEYRAQVSNINELLTQISSEKSAIERDLSLEKQTRADAEKHLAEALQQHEELRSTLSLREATILDLKRDVQELAHKVHDKQQEIGTLKNLCSTSGSNIDRLRETAARCAELQREMNAMKQSLELQQNETDHLRKQLEQVSGHRDALTVVLREFDTHFVSIQLQVQHLVRECDDLQFQNSQLSAELNVRERSDFDFQSCRRQEQQLLSQLKSDNASLVAVIRQHEDHCRNNDAQLKSLRADISDLQSSRESLLRDLQNERRLLAQATTRTGELESQLDLAKQDQNRMTKQIGSLQHTIEQQRGTISSLRSEADQLQSLITQLENVKSSESAEVARLRASLQAARDDISQRDDQITQYEMQIAQLNNQLESLKHVTQSLDAERDRLCHMLDEKCEQLAQAQQHLQHTDETAIAVQQASSQLQQRFDQLTQEHSQTLEHQHQQAEIIEHLQQNEKSLEAQIQLKNQEIETLMEDLRNMTSENQFVNGELSLALQEKDTKIQEAFAAVNKVLYLEEVLRVQKHEKEDLLSNYRMLSSENKRLLDTASELDSKCQQQLLDIQRLTERCLLAEFKTKELDDINRRLGQDIEQYQRSQERLTRSLATLQEQNDASNQEKISLMDIIQSSKSLSTGLEADREMLQHQLQLDQSSRNGMQNQIQELEARIQSQAHQNQVLISRIQELENNTKESSVVVDKLKEESSRLQEENVRYKQFIVAYEKKLSSKELALDSGDKSSDPVESNQNVAMS